MFWHSSCSGIPAVLASLPSSGKNFQVKLAPDARVGWVGLEFQEPGSLATLQPHQDLILEDEEEEKSRMGMVLEHLDHGKRTNPSLETWIFPRKKITAKVEVEL